MLVGNSNVPDATKVNVGFINDIGTGSLVESPYSLVPLP